MNKIDKQQKDTVEHKELHQNLIKNLQCYLICKKNPKSPCCTCETHITF